MKSRSQMKLALLAITLCLDTIQACEPRFTSIDYSNPEAYLTWSDTLGDRAAILDQARALKGNSDLASIQNVLSWMSAHLSFESEKAYAWRNYDDVIRERAYGGCADQAIVCGALLKGAGIPAVWVKSMDVTWIWDFKKGRTFKSWSGHVFLEVWVDQKWQLLDPGAGMLYGDYHPEARILPGNRFAYDKGNDPRVMIMSLQWEEWKKQTESYFHSVDEALLPVDVAGGKGLKPEAWIAGNSPYYQNMTRMASEAGLTVRKSFNTEFATFLPQAVGHILLIETHAGVPIMPINVLEKHFPGSSAAIAQSKETFSVAGTKIVFIDFSKPLQGLGLGDSESEAALK